MNLIKTIKNVIKKSSFRKTKRKNGGDSTFKQMNCSPAVSNRRIKSDSCFTPEIFITILKKYNEKNPNKQIIEKNYKKAWILLKQRLSCKKEECWLNQIDDDSMRQQIKKYVFAPKHPPEWNSNPDEWLSNFDIFEVVKQYEISHPEFKIIGPTTIDFDTTLPEKNGRCVLDDLCQFSLARFIKMNKTKIAIVFNLDKYYQSGSHWVSMFIDIKHKFIFFFDSADNGVPPEIWLKNPNNNKMLPLVNRIIQQGLELPKPIHFTFYNNEGVTHQKSNTECGMYSLFFIVTMLTGKTPITKGILSIKKRIALFLETKIPDTLVFKHRKIYFNE